MISTTFFTITLIITIISLVLLAIGLVDDIDILVKVGLLCMAFTYSFSIALSICSMSGDIQVWRTNELNDVLGKNTVKRCYIIDNNQLCGDFVYENKQFRYQVSGDTLKVLSK